MILLTVLTILAILLLVAVLVVGLVRIIGVLESIGGTSRGYTRSPSLLSKARWGVRAIEQQTGALEPQVTKLNRGLGLLDGRLGEVFDGVEALVAALERQRGSRP